MFRPMRRFKQQIPDEECRSILAAGKRGVLAVSGDGGYPYTVMLDYYFDEETGSILFHGAKEGHKIDAVRRCDKVSFLVLDDGEKVEGDWALYFKSVVVFGRIREITDPEQADKAIRKIGRKYYPDPEEIKALVERTRGRFLCLELIPEHMTGKRVHEK